MWEYNSSPPYPPPPPPTPGFPTPIVFTWSKLELKPLAILIHTYIYNGQRQLCQTPTTQKHFSNSFLCHNRSDWRGTTESDKTVDKIVPPNQICID